MPGCALRYCRNSSKNTAKSSGVTFHRFPRDPNVHREAWTSFVRTDRSEPNWCPTEHTYLCSAHFRENDFIYTLTGRKFTKLSAVPSIPSEFCQNIPTSVPSGAVNMETDGDEGTVDNEKWDGKNVAMEENVELAIADPSGVGLILRAATVPRVQCTECAVFGCRNNLTAKSGHRVCSDHFDVYDCSSSSSSSTNTLRDAAVPRRNLPLRRVSFTYDKAKDAGWQNRQITTEVINTMEVEIQLDPKEPINSTLIKQEPCSPNIAEVPCLVVSDPFTLTTEPQRTPSRKEIFLQRATISPQEHIYLPGLPADCLMYLNTKTLHVQTTKALLYNLIAPLRKQQEAELREVKRNIKAWETKMQHYVRSPTGRKEFQENCDLYLDGNFSGLVKFHVTVNGKASGKRYSTDFKLLALNLYFSSPRSYKFVAKLFNLPSRTTTARSQIPIRTGINASYIEYFKAKVDQMSAEEKVCAVCFDHMQLSKNLRYDVNNDFLYGLHDIDQAVGTEPAGYATLIMVKGLYSEWQQPISFAYLAEKKFYAEVKQWLYKIIALLFDIGLNVKALIMSLDTEFLEFPEVSIAEPYFEVFGSKVYQIFDVPALYKSARDALIKYDFHIGSKCVKWTHITKVYNYDKKQKLRLVPKLTDAHMSPEEKDYDAELAIQVFSRTMAAAMNYHVIGKLISASASDTVEFIHTMNNLFDILHSQKITHDNEFKRAYTNTEQQKKFLTNTFEYLKKLELKDKKRNTVDDTASFITGLLITIKSVVSLYEDLQKENFNFLLTKHLSLECIKTYFKKVRDLGGNCCTKPTPVMFARSFRRLFLVALVRNTKGESEMDLKTTLTKISEYVKINEDIKEETEAPHNRFFKKVGGNFLRIWPKPDPIFTGGFLLSKCLDKHRCQKLLESLCNQYNFDISDAESLINKFKEYKPKNFFDKTDLLVPPEFIVDAAKRMDKIFEDYIQRDDMEVYSFGWNIYLRMESEVFEMPCDCFPLMYLKQVCIRTKVFHLTRHYNSFNIKRPKKFRMVLKNRKGK
ncbi:hypothetical protein MSG28_014867 [Choristoneura fumiferana]|uniref:Uncharacterized protein n=1 Tax=Choristoneura fumiferana TaxID=7141 RepID=A0ACC0JT57_CHOFU|nr:hypothetical protein MSG28_014867 [Choristoneura fumiferana]